MLWETKTGSPVHYTEAKGATMTIVVSRLPPRAGYASAAQAAEPLTPPPSQISKVAAASTIPVTNAVAQANTRKSFRIPVIAAAPCVHGTFVRLP